jgi:hypothetical protein
MIEERVIIFLLSFLILGLTIFMLAGTLLINNSVKPVENEAVEDFPTGPEKKKKT